MCPLDLKLAEWISLQKNLFPNLTFPQRRLAFGPAGVGSFRPLEPVID